MHLTVFALVENLIAAIPADLRDRIKSSVPVQVELDRHDHSIRQGLANWITHQSHIEILKYAGQLDQNIRSLSRYVKSISFENEGLTLLPLQLGFIGSLHSVTMDWRRRVPLYADAINIVDMETIVVIGSTWVGAPPFEERSTQ